MSINLLLSMLTPYQFQALSDGQKSEYVWTHGCFLASNKTESQHCTGLFHVDGPGSGFFIEVSYNLEQDCVDSWRISRTHRILEPYLELIDLDKLLR